jgi:hypothetical protein
LDTTVRVQDLNSMRAIRAAVIRWVVNAGQHGDRVQVANLLDCLDHVLAGLDGMAKAVRPRDLKPTGRAAQPTRMSRDEFVKEVVHCVEGRRCAVDVATALGMKPTSVARRLQRSGRPDLAAQFVGRNLQ